MKIIRFKFLLEFSVHSTEEFYQTEKFSIFPAKDMLQLYISKSTNTIGTRESPNL